MIDALNLAILINKLLADIPSIVDTWHLQLANQLAPAASVGHDWDWLEQQIAAARKRGEKNPYISIGAGEEIAVRSLRPTPGLPVVDDEKQKVLLSNNGSGAEIILVVSWEDLRAGKVPGLS